MVKKAIWILEDDPAIQFIYSDALGTDYELTFFESLRDFLVYGKAGNHPDLLICDLQLKDGIFIHDHVERDELLRSMPFIIVSGLGDSELMELSLRKGALDYLSKPFCAKLLRVKVDWRLKASLFRLDRKIRRIHVGPRFADLTPQDHQLLELFQQEPDYRAKSSVIKETIWSYLGEPQRTQALKTAISKLRPKLIQLGLMIVHHKHDKDGPSYQVQLFGKLEAVPSPPNTLS